MGLLSLVRATLRLFLSTVLLIIIVGTLFRHFEYTAAFHRYKTGDIWRNTANLHTSKPSRFVQPTTKVEFVTAVRQARAQKKSVRIVGAAHSFTPLASTDGYLINLDKYTALEKVKGLEATFQAGVRIKDIHDKLRQHGLALPTTGAIHEQSLAGAVSTGTHGSSLKYGSFASLVTQVAVMNPRGEITEISPASNPDLFRSAVNGLGAFIIESLTIKCVQAHNLHKRESPAMPVTDAWKLFWPGIRKHDHTMFYWLPHTNKGRVLKMDVTDAPRSGVVKRFLDRNSITVFTALTGVSGFIPSLAPHMHRFIANSGLMMQTDIVAESDFALYIPTLPAYSIDIEYFVSLDQCEAAFKALRAVIDAHPSSFNLNGVVSVRLVKADDLYLSHYYETDSCAFDIFKSWGHAQAGIDLDLVLAVDKAFKQFKNARPHWGKYHNLSSKHLKSLYPKWSKFQETRKKFDPKGAFLNNYVEELFG